MSGCMRAGRAASALKQWPGAAYITHDERERGSSLCITAPESLSCTVPHHTSHTHTHTHTHTHCLPPHWDAGFSLCVQLVFLCELMHFAGTVCVPVHTAVISWHKTGGETEECVLFLDGADDVIRVVLA